MGPVCGVAGVVGPGAAEEQHRLGAMLRAQAHRGPDGSGRFVDTSVALVHNRLAVIDPGASIQPMCDEATNCVLIFNGEIYNYRELRSELQSLGHSFRTAGDTEVLLRSYLQWGDDLLDRLNGMFAFGVWDPRRGA